MSRRGAPQLLAWTKSREWREISSRQAKKNLKALSLRPRCGAHCRTTGLECRNPVVTGRTRCRLHGGQSGRGDQWGKPRWPDRNSPNAAAKLNRKLEDLQRSADKRHKRITRMTADERQAYEKWKRDHAPTSVADRKRARETRRQDQAARVSIAKLADTRPRSPEALELDARLAELRAELERRQTEHGGVFE